MTGSGGSAAPIGGSLVLRAELGRPRCTGRASRPPFPWVAVPSRKVAVLEARGRSCPGSGRAPSRRGGNALVTPFVARESSPAGTRDECSAARASRSMSSHLTVASAIVLAGQGPLS